ncbi:DUF1707 domain-containing protein [Kitasatospora arboriphila]
MTKQERPRPAGAARGRRAGRRGRSAVLGRGPRAGRRPAARRVRRGPLTVEEHSERIEAAYAAKTFGDLVPLTRDLLPPPRVRRCRW